MKKIILLAALVIGGTAFGQTTQKANTTEKKKSVEMTAKKAELKPAIEKEVEALSTDLKLTKEQEARTTELFKLREETYSNMPNLDDATKMEYDKKFETEFRSFVTPEQTKKLDELKVQENRKLEVSPVKRQPTEKKMTN